jgi:hypothetical protein
MLAFAMSKATVSLPSQCVWDAMLPAPIIITYLSFGTFGYAIYHFVAEHQFSSILTMAVVAQAMSICFLCIQVLWSGSAAGISAKSLLLDGISIASRMPATTWSEGYLPMDRSGDAVFQSVDFCSLAMILFLLHRVNVVQRHTYQASDDTFQIGPLILMSFAFSAFFHANAAANPLFDTCWMAGLYVGAGAVLPKLWLTTRTGGKANAMSCHYIAAMGASRALSGLFMWEARDDISCEEWVPGFNHGLISIILAHILHLLLLGDFTYAYVKNMVKYGITSGKFIDVQKNLPQFVTI